MYCNVIFVIQMKIETKAKKNNENGIKLKSKQKMKSDCS